VDLVVDFPVPPIDPDRFSEMAFVCWPILLLIDVFFSCWDFLPFFSAARARCVSLLSPVGSSFPREPNGPSPFQFVGFLPWRLLASEGSGP